MPEPPLVAAVLPSAANQSNWVAVTHSGHGARSTPVCVAVGTMSHHTLGSNNAVHTHTRAITYATPFSRAWSHSWHVPRGVSADTSLCKCTPRSTCRGVASAPSKTGGSRTLRPTSQTLPPTTTTGPPPRPPTLLWRRHASSSRRQQHQHQHQPRATTASSGAREVGSRRTLRGRRPMSARQRCRGGPRPVPGGPSPECSTQRGKILAPCWWTSSQIRIV